MFWNVFIRVLFVWFSFLNVYMCIMSCVFVCSRYWKSLYKTIEIETHSKSYFVFESKW